jgi:hypothetical protein
MGEGWNPFKRRQAVPEGETSQETPDEVKIHAAEAPQVASIETREASEPYVWLDRKDYDSYVKNLRNERNPLNTGAFEQLRQEGIAINSGMIRIKFTEKDGTDKYVMLNTDLGDHFLDLYPVEGEETLPSQPEGPLPTFTSEEFIDFSNQPEESFAEPAFQAKLDEKGIKLDSGSVWIDVEGKPQLMNTSREDFGTTRVLPDTEE